MRTSRVALTGTILGLLTFLLVPKAAVASDDYFYDGAIAELATVRTTTKDGAELEGARIAIGGAVWVTHGSFYLQQVAGTDRRVTDFGYLMSLRMPLFKRLEVAPRFRCGIESNDGGPRDGTHTSLAAGLDVGVWVTRRLQLAGFVEREKLFEDSRRDVGLALRWGFRPR